jgi:hypothetical protein
MATCNCKNYDKVDLPIWAMFEYCTYCDYRLTCLIRPSLGWPAYLGSCLRIVLNVTRLTCLFGSCLRRIVLTVTRLTTYLGHVWGLHLLWLGWPAYLGNVWGLYTYRDQVDLPIWAMFGAILPGILLYIILFIETEICQLIIMERTKVSKYLM